MKSLPSAQAHRVESLVMPAARTLQPQDQIAHYRIVGPLGAGGMGEVYLAQDQTLERSVALKILPPELVQSEERVRRFVREAKSASSLNHPNIVTIYEIGQDEVRAPEGVAKDPGSSAVHYISMELVSGETLTTKIHHDKTDLRTLLGYLAQAAEGLAKAHTAGIVHRDLKPSNIMVSKDGFAKVLDFGLAKLTERQSADADATSGPTEAEDGTRAGAVVGTVGYMSPEQVRGSTVDHRSDIFSFGCILYEAATRKKPFAAESNVETMHKILHDKPPPIEELNKEAPAELRRLIRRCLAKNVEQRLQSAKDLALELREIVEEYDSLSPSGTSGSDSSALAAAVQARRRISPAAMVAGTVVIAAVIVAAILMIRRGRDTEFRASATSMRISTVTSRGTAIASALSPDGRHLAYILSMEGQRSIWVRQVATGSDVQIRAPQKELIFGLTFTPDGSYLYYQGADPDRDGYNGLFEIPTLGGTPRKRTNDVDSRVTFSPDGKQICFMRGVPQKKQSVLVVFDLERGQGRDLASVANPVSFGQPAWSPDGKRIAVIENRSGEAVGSTIVTYRIADGRREPIGKNAWVDLTDLSWLPDGSGLLVSAFDTSTSMWGQLSEIEYPSGRERQITSDASSYFSLSARSDGATVAAVRTRRESNLWFAAPFGSRNVRQITFGSGEEGAVNNVVPAQDSTILFGMLKDGSHQVWSIGENGADETMITSGHEFAFIECFRPGVGIIFEEAGEGVLPHIWRANTNGENARQLTSGGGENSVDVSPDGRTLLFLRVDMPDVLWSISTEGGEPVRLGISSRGTGHFSPEGSRILHTVVREVQGQAVFTRQIIPATGGESLMTPALPPRADDLRWTPDGKGLTYLDASNERRNLFRLPLDGGNADELTHFTEARIGSHRWSPDGKHLLLRRRIGNADNLWVTGADGSNPTAVTDFETGNISAMEWSRDGSRVIFTYGETSQNVVLIRNFR